jgi:hypothetical protein
MGRIVLVKAPGRIDVEGGIAPAIVTRVHELPDNQVAVDLQVFEPPSLSYDGGSWVLEGIPFSPVQREGHAYWPPRET